MTLKLSLDIVGKFIFCEELLHARCWCCDNVLGLSSQVAGVQILTLPFTSNLLHIEFINLWDQSVAFSVPQSPGRYCFFQITTSLVKFSFPLDP